MTERQPPELGDLVGDELAPEELARLQRVHELLIVAGPPPELPPGLELAAEGRANVYPLFPRRRWAAAAAAAAALAAGVFGAGYLVGDRGGEPAVTQVVTMAGVDGARGARASLAIFPVDDGGNWPMELTVRGLAALPAGKTYSLWLVKRGTPTQLCGEFVVAGDKTVVSLNAPYKLKSYDGWVVTRTGSSEPLLTT